MVLLHHLVNETFSAVAVNVKLNSACLMPLGLVLLVSSLTITASERGSEVEASGLRTAARLAALISSQILPSQLLAVCGTMPRALVTDRGQ